MRIIFIFVIILIYIINLIMSIKNMNENAPKTNFGREIITWKVPEYEKYERTPRWYFWAIAITLLLLFFASFNIGIFPPSIKFSPNFLFPIIVILAAIVIITHDGQDPLMVNVSLVEEGIIVGKKFYDYDEFKDFSVIYKPSQDLKSLYLEFKNPIRPRLSVSLENVNPLQIRENLLKYISENLERTDRPLSEALAKIFKL